MGCGGGACAGVTSLVGGGASCVVLGGSSWWSVLVVLGGCSWAWRFLGGCGTCGVGLAGGGARVCGPACLPSALSAVSSSAFFLSLSFCLLFLPPFFLERGGVGAAFFGAVLGCGCVPVPVLVWAWVSWGTGLGWLLRSGFPVCAPSPRVPVSRVQVRGVLTAGGWR